jgi:hypothetical protein
MARTELVALTFEFNQENRSEITKIHTTTVTTNQWWQAEQERMAEIEAEQEEIKKAIEVTLKAAQKGDVDEIKKNIDKGVVFENPEPMLILRLFRTAASSGQTQVIQLLLTDSRSRRITPSLLQNTLMAAIEAKQQTAAAAVGQYIIAEKDSHILHSAIDAISRLMDSATTGHLDAQIEQEIAEKAPLLYQNPLLDLTGRAFRTAAEEGQWLILKKLLGNSPQESRSLLSTAPVYFACRMAAARENLEIITLLLEHFGEAISYSNRIALIKDYPCHQARIEQLKILLTLNHPKVPPSPIECHDILNLMHNSTSFIEVVKEMQRDPEGSQAISTWLATDSLRARYALPWIETLITCGLKISANALSRYARAIAQKPLIASKDIELIKYLCSTSEAMPESEAMADWEKLEILRQAVLQESQELACFIIEMAPPINPANQDLAEIRTLSKSPEMTALLDQIPIRAESNIESNSGAGQPSLILRSQEGLDTGRQSIWSWICSLPSMLWQKISKCFGY